MKLLDQPPLNLPGSCCLISEEEMTYLYGGAIQFEVGKYRVTINTEAIAGIMGSLFFNTLYVLGQGVFSSALNGVINSNKDGLSVGQTTSHFWNRQNTAGKIAAVLMTGVAGYYIGVQLYSLFGDLGSLWDEAVAEAAAEAALTPGPVGV